MPQDQAPPPEAQLTQAMFGFMVSKSLSVDETLNVADELTNGPRDYIAIAESAGVDPQSLRRVLRLLASVSIFAEPESGKYALTEVSDLLRTDHPGSMKDMAKMITSDSHWLHGGSSLKWFAPANPEPGVPSAPICSRGFRKSRTERSGRSSTLR